MSTAFSINDFMSEIKTRGVVRQHTFVVTMSPPPALNEYVGRTRPLTLRCEAASIPDVALATQEILRYGYGPLESAPYNAVFSGVNLTFVLDKNSFVYRYFYRWINSVVNFNTNQGMVGSNPDTGHNPYFINFKDNIVTEIMITMFDEQTQPIIQTKLHKAYPKAISAIDLNWGTNNDIVRLNVAMGFREFSSTVVGNIRSPVDRPDVYDKSASSRPLAEQSGAASRFGLGALGGLQA